MDATSPPRAGFVGTILNILQWLVFAFFALLAVIVLGDLHKLDVPNAPVTLFFAAMAVTILSAAVHLPPVFKRLPRKAKWAAYLAIIPAISVYGPYTERMREAYVRTPEGAREAAAKAERDQKQAAIDAANEKQAAADTADREKTTRLLADMETTKNELVALQAKLEGCFSAFGHRLPALEEPVKEALHNPKAFEHVETILIVPDTAGNNVALTFRAENGFGAVRTATVRAQLVADDCSVQNIKDPEVN